MDISLVEGLQTTRAIRRYHDRPISDSDLQTVLFSATRAPTGSNRQPFRFVVLRDGTRAADAKRLLGEAFRAGWAAKRAADRYAEGSGADPDSPKARAARAMQDYVDTFERVPVVILACVIPWREPDITMGASIYPACQNILLAARGVGLGGVLTMWHYQVDRELHELLAIPDEVIIAAVITLGHPKGRHGPVRRRPLSELVFDDGWGRGAPWIADPAGTRHTGRPPSAPRGT